MAVLFFFVLWYIINVVYNDSNKTVLKVLKLPWIVSALQLGIGLFFYTGPVWLLGLRKAPKLSGANAMGILPVALIHGAGQCVTVMSLGAGSLAFVNVVKSLEPLFNVLFGGIFMNDWLPWQVGTLRAPCAAGGGGGGGGCLHCHCCCSHLLLSLSLPLPPLPPLSLLPLSLIHI